VATASDDHTARVWEAATGKEVAVLRGHTDELRHVAFSPDGRRVLTAGMDPVPRVWDPATGKEILALKGHEASVAVALFSPDGRHILTGSSGSTPLHEGDDIRRQVIGARFVKDHTARLWDAATGKQEAVLEHDGAVSAAAFSPDGRRLATASGKGVRLWDSGTGREVLTVKGSEGWVSALGFSPRGRRLLGVSFGHGVRLWDAATGQPVVVLEGKGGFRSAAFTGDGRRIVTLSGAGGVRTWPSDPLAEALERKPRELTAEEREAFEIDGPEKP
jgi:WD40 repeat protein